MIKCWKRKAFIETHSTVSLAAGSEMGQVPRLGGTRSDPVAHPCLSTFCLCATLHMSLSCRCAGVRQAANVVNAHLNFKISMLPTLKTSFYSECNGSIKPVLPYMGNIQNSRTNWITFRRGRPAEHSTWSSGWFLFTETHCTKIAGPFQSI